MVAVVLQANSLWWDWAHWRSRAMPVEGTDKATLHAVITGPVAPGATIDTDGHAGYGDLSYQRETECLSAGAYVNGKARTNGIESFWALLKWACIAAHWWSKRHCCRYGAALSTARTP